MAKKQKTTFDYFAEIIAKKAPKYRDDFEFFPVTEEHIQRAARVAALVDKFFAPVYGHVTRHGEAYLRFHDWETLEIGYFGGEEANHVHYRVHLLRKRVEIPNGALNMDIFFRAVGMLVLYAAFEWARLYNDIGDAPTEVFWAYTSLNVETCDDAHEILKHYAEEALREKRDPSFGWLVQKTAWIAAVYGLFTDNDKLLAPIALSRGRSK